MREAYQCVKHGNLTYTEVRRMPVELRRWWLQQMMDENKPRTPEPQAPIGKEIVRDKPPSPQAPQWQPPMPHGLKVNRR